MSVKGLLFKRKQKLNSKNASKSCDLLKKRKELKKQINNNMLT
ncbi:hypothetical protein HNQ45_001233 [Nosocomiicoccus ampullae]|uniref:Uncharacterized protein n=1 Tax=Nosocomiicoccus ampullae TaxID=489910 RepID=A0A9Q2CZE7_9STAP|nr:hypothetical protein [Nosocomiicoccus ampullae]